MPEGPSLFKWCTMTKQFLGRKMTRISGSSKTIDKMKWSGATLEEVRVYGKRLFLHLLHKRESTGDSDLDDSDEESVWIRCHFLMWGSVRVNEFNCKPSKTNRFPEPRLVFYFSKEEFLVFYGGSFQEMKHPPEDESRTDILSNGFDRCMAEDRILGDLPISFILLDQKKFAGLGNIIKNEVLFSTGTHPMQLGCQLSRAKATIIVEKVVTFTKRWLSWKMEEKPSRKFGDWTEIYKKAMCPKGHKTIKSMFGPTGMERITYWCPKCQAMNNHDYPLSERRVWTNASDQDPETVEGPTVNGISQTIPNSEHQMATAADDTNMTESFAADHKVPRGAILTVKEIKQDGTPANINQELKFMEDFPMMQESQSSPKSKQTTLGPPHHQPEMNDTSLPTLSLETELNSFGTGHVGNKNLSPLLIEEPKQRLPSTKKIKLESEATCIFDLKEEEPAFTSSSSGSSCIVNSICVPDEQHHDEDSTRISVSISTIKELMRSHVRIKVKKLMLGKD